MKLNLDRVTLMCIIGGNPEGHLRSVEICKHYADFAAVKILSSFDIPGAIRIPPMDLLQYNRFTIKEMDKYFDTEYALNIHWDSHIVNPDRWTDDFYQYDYIGAPWFFYVDEQCVGNSGFSLQSKRLTSILANDPEIKEVYGGPYNRYNGFYPDDHIIGIRYRKYLERKGIKFPSRDIAAQFSMEYKIWRGESFGFHGTPCVANINRWENPIEDIVGPQICYRQCPGCDFKNEKYGRELWCQIS